MMMAAGVKNEKSSAALLYFLIPKGAILIGTKEEILNSWLKNFQDVKDETFLLFNFFFHFRNITILFFKELAQKGWYNSVNVLTVFWLHIKVFCVLTTSC